MDLIAKGKNLFTKKESDKNVVEQGEPTLLKAKTQFTNGLGTETKKQIRNIYIGLDFGTTFTKASYEIPSTEHMKYSVRFSNTGKQSDYFKSSVLFFNPKTLLLSFDKNTSSDIEVKYFKYSMISDSLPKFFESNSTSIKTENAKEELCSAFYLSCIISIIKDAVRNNSVLVSDLSDINWYINMGVPVTENNDSDVIYKTVLNVAGAFAEKNPTAKSVNLLEFDKFFSEYKNTKNNNLNTLPELYAEILLYQQDNSIPAGFYSVIDVGGGTVDISTFLKTIDTDCNGTEIECISQSVESLGFDSLSSTILRNKLTESKDDVKRFLAQTYIDYYMVDKPDDVRNVVPDNLIDYRIFYDCITRFRTAYGKCLFSAKERQPALMNQQVRAGQPMRYFLVGGAKKIPFYKLIIKRMITAHTKAGIPDAVEGNILRYLNNNVNLEVRNNSRLLISQMLAQPFEKIPALKNMPWNFGNQQIPVEKVDLRAQYDDIQRERYDAY